MREPVRDKGRLIHVLNAIDEILEYTEGVSYEQLCTDKIRFSAVVYKTVIIGEASHMLTQEFKDSHPETNWRAIKSMWNHIVHGYYQVNPEDVWDVIQHDLLPLKKQVEQYIKEIETNEEHS